MKMWKKSSDGQDYFFFFVFVIVKQFIVNIWGNCDGIEAPPPQPFRCKWGITDEFVIPEL